MFSVTRFVQRLRPIHSARIRAYHRSIVNTNSESFQTRLLTLRLPLTQTASRTRTRLTKQFSIMTSAQPYTEEWLEGPSDTKFYTRTYTPPASTPAKAVTVFVHGFAEHVARYQHFHPVLASKGIAIFTFDQRGFGLTAMDTTGKKGKNSAYGKTTWKEQQADIAWALNHAATTFPGLPLFLMGHSMVCLFILSNTFRCLPTLNIVTLM